MYVFARDVLDWKRGLDIKHEYDEHILYTAAEVAAGRRDRPVKKKNVRTKFLEKTRQMIEKADALDREKGRIKA